MAENRSAKSLKGFSALSPTRPLSEPDAQREERSDLNRVQERLRDILGKSREAEAGDDTENSRKPSVRERLDNVLHKTRETLGREDKRALERDDEIENTRDIDRGEGHSL